MVNPAEQSLVVVYHYVRPRDADPLPGIHPLWLDEFTAQLDWLQAHFDLLSPPDYLRWLRGDLNTGRPACLLTFDDGTKDQAAVSTPLLAARGLAAVFLMLSNPLVDGTAPVTHKLHYLLSTQPDAALWAHIQQAAADLWPEEAPEARLGSAAEAAAAYYYEETTRAQVKYALNVRLPGERAEALIARVLADQGIREREVAEAWFASPDEARAMHAAGMALGVHGRTHRFIREHDSAALLAEVDHCHAALSAITGESPVWYGPPFGGRAPGLMQSVEAALVERGYRAILTWAPGHPDILIPRSAARLPWLSRLDCTALPPRADPPPEVARLIG